MMVMQRRLSSYCVCFMVLDYLSTTLQSYEKFLRYANIQAIFFLKLWGIFVSLQAK